MNTGEHRPFTEAGTMGLGSVCLSIIRK